MPHDLTTTDLAREITALCRRRGPMTVAQLAEQISARRDATERVVRALVRARTLRATERDGFTA